MVLYYTIVLSASFLTAISARSPSTHISALKKETVGGVRMTSRLLALPFQLLLQVIEHVAGLLCENSPVGTCPGQSFTALQTLSALRRTNQYLRALID